MSIPFLLYYPDSYKTFNDVVKNLLLRRALTFFLKVFWFDYRTTALLKYKWVEGKKNVVSKEKYLVHYVLYCCKRFA